MLCVVDEVDYSEQQTKAIDRIKDLTGRDIAISIDDVRLFCIFILCISVLCFVYFCFLTALFIVFLFILF